MAANRKNGAVIQSPTYYTRTAGSSAGRTESWWSRSRTGARCRETSWRRISTRNTRAANSRRFNWLDLVAVVHLKMNFILISFRLLSYSIANSSGRRGPATTCDSQAIYTERSLRGRSPRGHWEDKGPLERTSNGKRGTEKPLEKGQKSTETQKTLRNDFWRRRTSRKQARSKSTGLQVEIPRSKINRSGNRFQSAQSNRSHGLRNCEAETREIHSEFHWISLEFRWISLRSREIRREFAENLAEKSPRISSRNSPRRSIERHFGNHCIAKHSKFDFVLNTLQQMPRCLLEALAGCEIFAQKWVLNSWFRMTIFERENNLSRASTLSRVSTVRVRR